MSTAVGSLLDTIRTHQEREAVYTQIATFLKQHYLSRDGGQAARTAQTRAFGTVRELTIREIADELQNQAVIHKQEADALEAARV